METKSKTNTKVDSDYFNFDNPKETTVVRVSDHVEDYKILVSKSSTSILELAEFIGKLKDKLSASRFSDFCKQIGTTQTNAYIKKMCCINKKLSVFNSLKDRLPSSYTTLYALTQLTDEQFQRMIDDDEINPFMTGMTVAKYATKKPVLKREVALRIPKDISDGDTSKFCTRLQELCKEFKIEPKFSFEFDTVDDGSFKSMNDFKDSSELLEVQEESDEVIA